MILVIGPGGAGLSFITWSIIFLRGDLTYLNLEHQLVSVNSNPLINQVAHDFDKDHIRGIDSIPDLESAHDKTVVFFVPEHQKDLDQIVDIDCKKIIFDSRCYGPQLLARMIACLPTGGAKLLFENLRAKYDQNKVKTVLSELHRHFTGYYQMPQDKMFLPITYNNIFDNLDQYIFTVFEHCRLNMNMERYQHWLKIYHEYRARNQNIYQDFVADLIEVDRNTRLSIAKDVVKWINGTYRAT
mgnify:CR=1 FL=1